MNQEEGADHLDGAAQFLDVDKSLLSGVSPEVILQMDRKAYEIALEREDAENANQRLLDLQLDKDSLEHQLRESQTRTSEVEVSEQLLRKELQEDIQRLGPGAEEAAQAHAEAAELARQLEQATSDKRALLDSLERRKLQVQDLTLDLEASTRRAADLRLAKQQLETQTETSATELAKLRSSRTILQYDLDGSKSRVERLSKDLQNRETETLKAMAEFEQQLETKIRALASSETTARGLQSANSLLRSQNEDMSTRLSGALAAVQKLKVDADTERSSFLAEMGSQKRENELLNSELNRSDTLVAALRQQIAALEDADARASTELQRQLDAKTQQVQDLKSKLDYVDQELASIYETGPSARPGSNGSNGPNGSFDASNISLGNTSVGSIGGAGNVSDTSILSPSAGIMRELQRRGGSFVDLHQSYYKSKAEAGKWKRRYEALRRDMDGILQEIEINAPSLQAERQEYQRMRGELVEFSQRLEDANRKEEAASSKAKSLEQKIRDQTIEHGLIARQVTDLSRQVQHLLINGQLAADGESLLTSEEKYALAQVLQAGDSSDNADGDVNNVISERMLLFKDIGELQTQNSMLLKACRSLSTKMEQHEEQLQKQYDELETEAVADAKKAIVALQAKVAASAAQLDAVRKERDAFRALAEDPSAVNPLDKRELEARQQLVQQLETQLGAARAQIADIKQDTHGEIERVRAQADQADQARHELVKQLATAEARVDQANQQQRAAESTLQLARNEQTSLQSEIGALKETLARQDERARTARDEMLRTRTEIGRLQSEVAQAQSERQQWSVLQQSLNQQVFDATQEAARLRTSLAELRARQASGSPDGDSEQHKRLFEQAETLQLTVSQLSLRLGQAEDDLKLAHNRRESESAAHQQQVLGLTERAGELQQQLLRATHDRETVDRKLAELETQLAAAEDRARSRERYMAGEIGEVQHVREELEIAKQISRESAVLLQSRELALQEKETEHAASQKTAADQLAAKDAAIQAIQEELAAVRAEAQTLRQTLDSLSTQDLQATIDTLQASETELRKSRAELRSQLAEQQQVLSATEASLTEARAASGSAEHKAASLETSNRALNHTVEQLNAKHAALVAPVEQRVAQQSQQQSHNAEQLELLKSKVEELEAANTDLLFQLEKVVAAQPQSQSQPQQPPNDSVDGMEVEPETISQALIAQLRRKLDLTTGNLETARQEALALTRKVSASESHAANLSAQLEDLKRTANAPAESSPAEAALQAENSQLRSQLDAFNGRARDLEGQAAQAQSQLDALRANLLQVQHESESRLQQINQLETDNKRWQSRLAQQAGNDAEARAAALQDELDNSKALLGKLRSEAQEKLDKGRKERQELREEVARLQTAVQAAVDARDAAQAEASQKVAAAEAAQKVAAAEAETRASAAESKAVEAETKAAAAEKHSASLEEEYKQALQSAAVVPSAAETDAVTGPESNALESELAAKEKRIEDLETECNRLSDEILEAQSAVQAVAALETKLEAADAEIKQLREQVAGLDALQQQVAELSAAPVSAEAEAQAANLKIQLEAETKLVQEQLAENKLLKGQLAEKDSFEVDSSALEAAVAALRTDLVAKSSEEEVAQYGAQLTGQVKEQLKKRANEHVARMVAAKLQDQETEFAKKLADTIDEQQATFKKDRETIEAAISRKFEFKQKLLKQKADKLEATNQELSLTVRKLKGGIDVDVITTATGVTKVIPSGPAQPQAPAQAHAHAAPTPAPAPDARKQKGRAQLQRPLVNRVGRAPKRPQEQGQANGNKKRRED